MNPDHLEALLEVARSKAHYDKQRSWSKGSITYLEEMRTELDEVQEEMNSRRRNYLEDELGDVLWDYLNLLINLEQEDRIDAARVFHRALEKYRERIQGIGNGKSWAEVKALQKVRLAEEFRRQKSAGDD